MSEKPPARPGRLRINKRLYIVLICFLISTVFWLLIALSSEYPSTVVYQVRYTNLPGKKVVMNDLPAHIAVDVRASGFKLMSFGINRDEDSVEVDVAASMTTFQVSNDFLALPTRSFIFNFAKELGKDVEITGFNPDSIVFSFSDLTTKKVPVIMPFQATFEKQFDTTGPVQLNPAMIEVSGPPSMIHSLSSIQTEKMNFSKLKTPAKGKVRLVRDKLLSYNVDEVDYTLNVEKFTEGTADVEVHPINVKEGFSLKTFPDKVRVRYQVALSKYNQVTNSMFDAMVDATEADNHKTSKLKVKLVSSPSFVKVASVEPDKVDYILRKQ